MAQTKKDESFYKLLSYAVSMEDAGYAFYRRANEVTKIAISRVTLSALADDELKHKVAITRFCKAKEKDVQPKTGLKELFGLPVEDLERQITAYTPLEEIYEFAKNFEKQSHEYYVKLKQKTKDKEALRLLGFLAGEENRHYKLLSGTLQYLARPSDWFAQEERPVVEG